MKTFDKILGAALFATGGGVIFTAALWAAKLTSLDQLGLYPGWVIAFALAGGLMMGGGWVLMKLAAPPSPKAQLDWRTVEKILMVGYPGGSKLLALMDSDRQTARLILDWAYRGDSSRAIFRSALSVWVDHESDPSILDQAIREALALYGRE